MQSSFVYLAQTDTTVGFLSSDALRLTTIKQRAEEKPFLKVTQSLNEFQKNCHVPQRHKNRVRRASKTTFVDTKGQSCRYVSSSEHHMFLQKYGTMFSTSANPPGERYSENFAWEKSDVVVVDKRGIFEAPPSQILRLGKRKLQRLR